MKHLVVAILDAGLRFGLSPLKKRYFEKPLKKIIKLVQKNPIWAKLESQVANILENQSPYVLPVASGKMCAKFRVSTMISLGGVSGHTDRQTSLLYYMYRLNLSL